MASIIQTRRDSAANWTANNPTLADGEWGYEQDTGNLKIGDGTTNWAGLPYRLTSGEVNTASNIGNDGVGVFASKSAADLRFRHIAPGSSKITVTLVTNDIDIDVDESAIDHDALLNYDVGQHREINDSGTATTDLWSASKINTELGTKASASHTHTTADITSGTFSDARISESSVTQHEGAIDHDALTNFVANEHIDHTSVTLTAGAGLTGGGDISANRTFALDIANLTGVTATATDELAIADVDDSDNIKKITVQSILDLIAADADEQVKVSANDTTSGYLEQKIVSANSILTIATLNDGGDEDLELTVDETAIDHNNLTNYDISQHRIINDAGTSATELWSASKISTELSGKAASSHTHAASEIVSGTFADARIAASNVTQHVASIDHDLLLNTHNLTTDIDHDTITNTHNLTTDIDHDLITGFVSNEHIDHTAVTLTAGDGLSGGGDISASRTFNVDIAGQTAHPSIDNADVLLIEDVSDSNATYKITLGDIVASGGGITSIGTIDSVTKSSNAAVISGNNLIMQSADATNPGVVLAGTQTFAGIKTFNNTTNSTSTTTGAVIISGGLGVANRVTVGSISSPGSGSLSERFGASSNTSTAINATAVGNLAAATGDRTTCIGTNSSASGADSIAIGRSVSAGSATFAVVIGNSASVGNVASPIAVGPSAQATQANAVSFGAGAQATASQASSFGRLAIAAGTSSVAAGFNANVTAGGSNGVAIGNSANSAGAGNIAIGSNSATGTGASNLALGASSTTATGNTGINIAIGDSSTAVGGQSTSIGYLVNNQANQTTCIGVNSSAASTATIGFILGPSCSATTPVQTVIGFSATGSGSNACTTIGGFSSSTGTNNIVIGAFTGASGAGGALNIGGGFGTNAAGSASVCIGPGANTSAGHTNSIAFVGPTSAANQFNVGSATNPITSVFVGEGASSTTTQTVTWANSDGSGTNNAGGAIVWRAGRSTGNATPATFTIETTTAGASGSTVQTAAQAIRASAGQSVEIGSAAITTTSTDGFPYIPGAAGAPTGTPSAKSGFVPIYYDTTNDELYVYNGSWVSVALA